MAAIPCADAQTPTLPDPHQTDPVTLGIMQGFLPSPDKAVRFDNGTSYRFPFTRWAFSHMRELVPTANVRRGERMALPLPRTERDFMGLSVTTMDGKSI